MRTYATADWKPASITDEDLFWLLRAVFAEPAPVGGAR